MDIGRAFTFFFNEDRWIEKLAIGTGLLLISAILGFALIGIIGAFILTGYSLRLMRNVEAGKTQVLPEWNEWGDDLVRGFKLMVVGFVWSLPALVFAVPTAIGGMMTNGGDAAQFFGIMIILCSGVVIFLYTLFVLLITPGYTIAFAQDERISSGLQLGEIWAWTRQNIGQVIIVAIVVALGAMAIMLLASIVGAVLCFIGLAVTLPLAVLVVSLFQYHLYGQLAREHPFGDGPRNEVMGPIVDGGVATAPSATAPPTPADTSDATTAAQDSTP